MATLAALDEATLRGYAERVAADHGDVLTVEEVDTEEGWITVRPTEDDAEGYPCPGCGEETVPPRRHEWECPTCGHYIERTGSAELFDADD